MLVDGPSKYSLLHNQKKAGLERRHPALPILLTRLAPHAILVVDDATLFDKQAMVRRWCKEYPVMAKLVVTEKGTAIVHQKGSSEVSSN